MEAKFSPQVKDVISFSREEALRLGHDYIGAEHLLLGLIREGDGMAIKILKSLGVDTSKLRRSIEDAVRGTSSVTVNLGNIPLTKQAEKVLKITYLEAIKHEFKKDPQLQNTTRNIAYEIIAEKVATRSEIVNELKHFNPDDEVILKDISRYKTGRNNMFRN